MLIPIFSIIAPNPSKDNGEQMANYFNKYISVLIEFTVTVERKSEKLDANYFRNFVIKVTRYGVLFAYRLDKNRFGLLRCQ